MNRETADINFLLKMWTLDLDGEIPIQFDSELSRYFFSQDLCRLLNKYYTLGRKYEKKKRKIKQSIKRKYYNGRRN